MKFKFTVIILFIFGNIFAQGKGIFDTLPSISIGAGVLSFKGDVGKDNTVSPSSRMRAGYSIAIGQRINNMLDVSISGVFGKLTSTEYTTLVNRNFESKIKQLDVSVLFRTDELLSEFSLTPYVGLGLGFMSFDPHADLLDKNGNKYFYWTDGSVRDRTENIPNTITSRMLIHDYNYETQLKDSAVNYSRKAMTIPLTIGLNFSILNNLSAKIGLTYFMIFSDYVDNVKANGNNDSYTYSNVTVTYRFRKFDRKKAKIDDSRYDDVDFNKIEEDLRKKKQL